MSRAEDSGDHHRRGDDNHRRNGDKFLARVRAHAITAAFSIASAGFAVPVVFPNLGVPDRFTGTDASVLERGLREELQREIDQLREDAAQAQREQIETNQALIIRVMDEQTKLLTQMQESQEEMQRAQLQHFANEHQENESE